MRDVGSGDVNDYLREVSGREITVKDFRTWAPNVIKDNNPNSIIHVGCAAWALPKEHAARFSAAGTHLVRYAGELPAVEINSSFYKPHKPATYTKWAESVPDEFRFAVKVPKEVTHVRRLIGTEEILDRFLSEATALGGKLGPLLIQLPPSLAFTLAVAEHFFGALRERFNGDLVLEPRHASWFEPKADKLVAKNRVARVAADPAVVKGAAEPGGWNGLAYYRLHGTPKIYYSDYPSGYLDILAEKLSVIAARSVAVWCIFDNTATGAATANALGLLDRLAHADDRRARKGRCHLRRTARHHGEEGPRAGDRMPARGTGRVR